LKYRNITYYYKDQIAKKKINHSKMLKGATNDTKNDLLFSTSKAMSSEL
jgi:hypothetical protein